MKPIKKQHLYTCASTADESRNPTQRSICQSNRADTAGVNRVRAGEIAALLGVVRYEVNSTTAMPEVV